MAAAARVHRRDQLDPRREGDVGVGAGDADLAGLERLAQRIEHRALEFGQLVEEQHAEMGEADLARPHLEPAADQRRHRGAVVRRAERAAAAHPPALQLAGDAGDHRHFERLGRRRAPAGSRAGRRRAATCPRPAARSSADCGRRPRRSRARAWRSPGPSPGRGPGRRPAARPRPAAAAPARGVPLKWLSRAIRSGAATTSTSPAQAASAPCAAGQIRPSSRAEAWSAASSTPGDGAIRPSRPARRPRR